MNITNIITDSILDPVTDTIVYNLIPSNTSFNLFKLTSVLCVLAPAVLDLTKTKLFPPVYSQGNIGSCVAQVISAAYTYAIINKQLSDPQDPSIVFTSRLALYYNMRLRRVTVNEDSGATIEDGMLSLREGACDERLWRYDISRFREAPPLICVNDSGNHRAVEFERVEQSLSAIKCMLYRNYPVSFGIILYENHQRLSSVNEYILEKPSKDDSELGGHAVVIVGYDDNKKIFKVRTSWGQQYGKLGHFYISYDYVLDNKYSFDFWAVTKVYNKNAIDYKPSPVVSSSANDSYKNTIIRVFMCILIAVFLM